MNFEQRNWRPDLRIDRGTVKRTTRKTTEFRENPSPLTKEELEKMEGNVVARIRPLIEQSNLGKTNLPIKEKDIEILRELIEVISEASQQVVTDEKRRPWNTSCRLHLEQSASVVEAICDELLEQGTKIDKNKIRAKALVHDIGRYASHEEELHGSMGRRLLKKIGVRPDLRVVTLAHLIAGFGIRNLKDERELAQKINDLEGEVLENAIVELAENLRIRRSYVDSRGLTRYYQEIAERSWDEEAEQAASRRATWDSADILKRVEQVLVEKFGIKLKGPDGAIAKAQRSWVKNPIAREISLDSYYKELPQNK